MDNIMLLDFFKFSNINIGIGLKNPVSIGVCRTKTCLEAVLWYRDTAIVYYVCFFLDFYSCILLLFVTHWGDDNVSA